MSILQTQAGDDIHEAARATPELVLGEITRRLVDSFHPDKIILFGSHAWGVPDADSDVDLLVVVDHSDDPPHRRAQAGYRALRGLRLPCDLLVRTRAEIAAESLLPSSLLGRAFREGVVLHG